MVILVGSLRTHRMMEKTKVWLGQKKKYPKHLDDIPKERQLTDEEFAKEITKGPIVGLLWKTAEAYASIFHEVSLQELFQEGILGCYDARRLFDKTSCYKFSTYARFWCKKRMREFVKEEMRHGLHVSAAFKGNIPFDSLDDVVREAACGERPVHLRDTVPDRDYVRPVMIPDEFWRRARRLLLPNLYNVLRLRIVEKRTKREAGKLLGLSKSRVHQLEMEAHERIAQLDELRILLSDSNHTRG